MRGHHLRNLKDVVGCFGPSKYNPKNYSEFYDYFKNHKGHYAEAVYMKIIENPHLKITITDSLDHICRMCGKHDDFSCTKLGEDEMRLKTLDNEVINYFGLFSGAVIPLTAFCIGWPDTSMIKS